MPQPLKPSALKKGDAIRLLSPASPIQEALFDKGCDELKRLGYAPQADRESVLARESFFAGSAAKRTAALRGALTESDTRAIFCTRGGYGSNYLLDGLDGGAFELPKILMGCSDVTSLQLFLWQKWNWVTFYGPMVATNFSCGPGLPHGYDCQSLTQALTQTDRGWRQDLYGEPLTDGDNLRTSTAEGMLLGGCLTLVETSIGTPWDLQAEGAILVLEDRGMKPYQVDRSLMHLKQAGKFRGVAGIVLGEFPDCEAAMGDETVRDVARRVLGPLGVPIVWGAPIGHTNRAMLTIPFGVRAKLMASNEESAGSPYLEILEAACVL